MRPRRPPAQSWDGFPIENCHLDSLSRFVVPLLPNTTFTGMNSLQAGRALLPESTLQSKHDLLQVNPVHMRKFLLAQKVVCVRIPPVMPRAKRDR
jgi:hypothetical protein